MLKLKSPTYQDRRVGITVAALLVFGIWAWPHQQNHGPSATRNSKGSCLDIWQRKIENHERLLELRRAVVVNPTKFKGKNAYDPYEPSYTCDTDNRRGKAFGDGGKFVCGDPEYFKTSAGNGTGETCLVYSVGSNGDASFEKDIASSFGCEVHTFDPTGNSTAYSRTVQSVGGRFHALGVSGQPTTMINTVTGAISQLMPLQDIIHKLGHAKRHVSILKIDCEGCEYEAFASLWPHIQAGDVFVGQIQIELHGTNFQQLAGFFDNAAEFGYMIFHKERNHWGCAGYHCVEFSLIHKNEAKRIYDFTHCK